MNTRRIFKRRELTPRAAGFGPRGALGVATLLMTGAVCVADVPTDQGTGVVPLRPAPNQSVSIDVAGDGAAEGSVDAAGQTVEQDPHRFTPVGQGSDSRAATATSRLVRRKPAAALGEGADHDRSMPWYRTGLGALAIVLALVGAAFWLVRRWMPSARIVDAGVMKIVGRTGLTPKHSLALVRVGRRYVMVGVSADHLDALCEISNPEEVAELSARVGIDRSLAAEPFDALLAGEASDYHDSQPSPSDTTTTKRSRLAGSSGSLTDLLGRLRALQV